MFIDLPGNTRSNFRDTASLLGILIFVDVPAGFQNRRTGCTRCKQHLELDSLGLTKFRASFAQQTELDSSKSAQSRSPTRGIHGIPRILVCRGTTHAGIGNSTELSEPLPRWFFCDTAVSGAQQRRGSVVVPRRSFFPTRRARLVATVDPHAQDVR